MAHTARLNAVRDRIRKQSRGDRGATLREIEVEVLDGIVVLTGTVDDPRKKYAAAEAAQSVDGVRGVINLIKAPEEAAWCGDTPQVQAALDALRWGISWPTLNPAELENLRGTVA